jgi:aminoglycoside/choline kinase family phosphotransferase
MSVRADQITAFLRLAGWEDAASTPLAGDASTRSYQRLHQNGQSVILMDTPRSSADDPAQFLIIAQHLNGLGLSAPRCLAQDLPNGLLLLEDFGDGVFASIISSSPSQEPLLYLGATRVLHHLQSVPAPSGLPNFSATDWADAAMLVVTRYTAALADSPQSGSLHLALAEAISRYADGPRVMILRDYHALNLMHLPDRAGLAQVGLLDFQTAQLGQPCYDLVSLLQDARRAVSPQTQSAVSADFLLLTGQLETDFTAAYAVVGAQRALRILGIFAQLCTHQGKAGYLSYLPRVWGHLQQNLAHPALRDVANICAKSLPPPSESALQILRSKCQIHP